MSLDALLADLELLVGIESPSRDVAALTASAEALADLLERRLGRPATLVDGVDGPHVRWSGGGDPCVLLLGHHDTVFPIGTLARRPFAVADGRATGHAGANLAEWVGSRAVTGRVDRFLDELADAATAAERTRLRDATVVLDPPRSGAGRAVVDRLAELRPRQLVYVACDPVALARDVGLLREQGYELDHLVAFDLFPSTHHVEAVARLTAIV